MNLVCAGFHYHMVFETLHTKSSFCRKYMYSKADFSFFFFLNSYGPSCCLIFSCASVHMCECAFCMRVYMYVRVCVLCVCCVYVVCVFYVF